MSKSIGLVATLLLLACGGGGEGTPAAGAGPAWGSPFLLDERADLTSGALAGDGTGAALAVWRRRVLDARGREIFQQVAARLGAEGTWQAEVEVGRGEAGDAFGVPVAAVEASGRGWLLWLAEYPGGGTPSTELTEARVDLRAATPVGSPQKAFIFPFGGCAGLRLAADGAGSARTAWTYPGAGSGASGVPLVGSARFVPSGVWEVPVIPGGNAGAGMGLQGLVGDGRGGTVVEQFRANDQPMGEAWDFAASGAATAVAGWEPAVQVGLASHTTAWAADGQGGLEAWLVYANPGAGTPFRQAWPRRRSAAGLWTVGGAVDLPRPAEQLGLFRDADGRGWMAGAGTEGLWTAPLTGTVPGTAKLLLPAPAEALELVAVRDAAGRPALLWIQRRGGASEGVGFSRLEAGAWTEPTLLPGTAGALLKNLRAAAGPKGLVATWEAAGGPGRRLQAALWR